MLKEIDTMQYGKKTIDYYKILFKGANYIEAHINVVEDGIRHKLTGVINSKGVELIPFDELIWGVDGVKEDMFVIQRLENDAVEKGVLPEFSRGSKFGYELYKVVNDKAHMIAFGDFNFWRYNVADREEEILADKNKVLGQKK